MGLILKSVHLLKVMIGTSHRHRVVFSMRLDVLKACLEALVSNSSTTNNNSFDLETGLKSTKIYHM
jgi:hypothetical protein